jgi:anti-anti-sigma factor
MEVRELEVTVRRSDGAAVIDLKGELNASAERSLDVGYAEAMASGASSIALNFTATDYINSTGIALIVGLLGQARSKGIEVRAFGLSDHYREIFEITRLADFMRIEDTEQGAVSGTEGKEHA